MMNKKQTKRGNQSEMNEQIERLIKSPKQTMNSLNHININDWKQSIN